MFESILECYNNLINERGKMKLLDIAESMRQIKTDQEKLQCDLQTQNEKQIEALAKQRVIEFVNNNTENVDFFNQIERIRIQTNNELIEQFTNTCIHWMGILNNAEQHLLLLLKERLCTETIKMGTIKGKDGTEEDIEWTVLAVDPVQNQVQLISTKPLAPFPFHKKGYTDIEDDDVFCCTEIACSWKDSDIRSYLNNKFYNEAFSAIEKEYITPKQRHYNKSDFLIPNDIAEDKVYLLKLDEFLRLPPEVQLCTSPQENDAWWLCEQKARGWEVPYELPKLYAVDCKTGKLTEATPEKMLSPRACITVKLDSIINSFSDVLLW